ncbi:MAG: acyl-CoA desaturase [Gammaproteobacteria bacterium]|nr:acyl-CoA desaturase [Gammaproteobacteria bacterium]
MPHPLPHPGAERIEAFGRDMDAIRDRVLADLGERDARYIRRIVRIQRGLELGGRGLLFLGFFPPAWLAGVAALSASKILDNMEIGHNIMHGQYDWMNDPAYSSRRFDWDTACPSDQWRHSHNYLHHTYTNVQGVDRDIGYGVLRMSDEKRWHPYFLLNPLWAFLLAVFFQYGVALHDLEVERVLKGKKDKKDALRVLKGIWTKTRGQTLKDYVAFPLLAGPFAPFVFAGNLAANLARNLWAYTIIFCGHFPDGVRQFPKSVLENETRAQWYHRQLLGSANLTGGPLFHIMSGNLSHQIEHHLFPNLPAHRYADIAQEVRAACRRHGLPYNTGPLWRQFGTVVRRIFRLALPTRPQAALGAAAGA